MELHGVDQIISAINAKSYSVVPQKPDIGYPPNGRFEEIFDLEDKKKLHPDAKVVSAIAKDHHSYQSNEELCYMMRVNSNWPPKGFLQEPVHFVLQRCSRRVSMISVGCMFQRKIFLKVSGLCNFSPVDTLYTLMELDQVKHENYYRRRGTFSGLLFQALSFKVHV